MIKKQLVKTIPPFQMELPIGVYDGSIIDFETTGCDPFSDEIITLGYIQKNQLCIIQRCIADPISFYNKIKEMLGSLDRPFYTYNAEFEAEFAKTQLELEFSENEFVDLFEPWKSMSEREGMKWPKLDELVSDPLQYYPIRRIHSVDIPRIWRKYLMSRDINLLNLIIHHNKRNLLKELFLLVYAPVLYDELKSRKRKR